jgi:hypothetical protein
MKRILSLVGFVAVLVLCAAAQAQKNDDKIRPQYAFKMDDVKTPNTPTLDETLEWMQTSIKVDTRYAFVQEHAEGATDTYIESIDELTAAGCQITITQHATEEVSSDHPRKKESLRFTTDKLKFNLRDLDPSAIQIVPAFIYTYNENTNPKDAEEAIIDFQT